MASPAQQRVCHGLPQRQTLRLRIHRQLAVGRAAGKVQVAIDAATQPKVQRRDVVQRHPRRQIIGRHADLTQGTDRAASKGQIRLFDLCAIDIAPQRQHHMALTRQQPVNLRLTDLQIGRIGIQRDQSGSQRSADGCVAPQRAAVTRAQNARVGKVEAALQVHARGRDQALHLCVQPGRGQFQLADQRARRIALHR